MTLPISFAHAQELARLCEHETRPELVVIGAAALGHHIPLSRITHDVDLALVVAPQDIGPLLRNLGWLRDERITHRSAWRRREERGDDVRSRPRKRQSPVARLAT